MHWGLLGNILIFIGCVLILLPFLGYALSKCITFGILTAKKQYKEYENGKSNKNEEKK